MTVYLVEDRELPIVAGTAVVRTGSLFDPPEKAGLANLTGQVMRSGGTKTRPGEQLDEQLDRIAATVESTISGAAGVVSFSTLRENSSEVLEIFRDVLVSPEFRQDKIDLGKAQLRNLVARRNDDARALASREFQETVYGKETPFGRRIEYASLNQIARGDLQAFHRRYFFPANVILAVRGDFTTAEMKTRIESLFLAWNEKQEVVPEFPRVPARPAPGIFLAERKDIRQTFFSIGHLGGAYNDKDYPALQIAVAILGGGPQSRLYDRLRNRMGAASEIAASWNSEFHSPGLFRITGAARPGMASQAIEAVLDEVARLRNTDVTDEELKSAKDAAVNSLVFASDTRAKTLNRLLNYAYFAYPADFLEQLQKGLAAVTKAEVRRAANERLNPDRFTIVVAGTTLEFGQNLEALGKPVTRIDLAIAQPKIEAAKTDESTLEKGKRLLARAQEAVGGADRLASIKDTVLIANMSIAPAAGGMQVVETDQWIAPSLFRQESQIERRGKIVAFFDGKTGRISAPSGSAPLTEPQLNLVKGDLFRLYIPLLLSNRVPGRKVSAIDDRTIEISDDIGNVCRLVLDLETGLPSRVLYDMLNATGSQTSVEDILSDFREAAGLKIPYAVTIMQSGQKFADVAVKDFQVNKGLKPEDLRRLQ